MRGETRRERYDSKAIQAKTFPVSLTAINFHCDENLGYLIRTAACFGATAVNVIGCIPDKKELRAFSGSLVDYIQINQFSTPEEFIEFSRSENIELVSAELTEGASNLEHYSFDCDKKISIVVGNETGYCLNTAQTANIMLYEAVKQYKKQMSFFNSINEKQTPVLM
jgi:tRNA G18 (ribose-2'-O)-methylase SpoU